MLSFRLGSIPVRVRGWFIVLVLALGATERRPELIATWAVIAFLSVLVHELGHAMMGRAFGLEPQIELNGLGGLTSWANPRDVGNGRSILISLAGPCAGFAMAALLVIAKKLGLEPQSTILAAALHQAILLNFVWGVYNLAPMLPLDGGNVMRGFLNILTKGNGEKPARLVSIVVGGLFLVAAFLVGALWLGMLAGFFTWANVIAYRQIDARRANAPLANAIEEAHRALEQHDGAKAIELLRPALVPDASPELRALALRVYCYALLIEGEWAELLPTLAHNAVLIGPEEMTRYARTAHEMGRETEAQNIAGLLSRLAPVVPRPANDFG